MRVKRGWLLLGAMAAAALLWFGAPPLLRQLDFFRVRRIEVRGAEHVDPDAVAAALRLGPAASVFDDRDAYARRVLELPGLVDAAVDRRFPGTLLVDVVEDAPVALSPGQGTLAMVSARGRRLPFDPAYSAPDLPVVYGVDSAAAELLSRVREADPELFGRISVARRRAHDIVLEIGGRRILVMPQATAEEIRVVMAVARDLAETGRPYTELDARFAGKVYVRQRAT